MDITGFRVLVLALAVLPAAESPALVAKVSTFGEPWCDLPAGECKGGEATVEIDVSRTEQEIVGFGCAASELGWKALECLSGADRAAVFDELCRDGGFTVIRTPIGASDFALDYYSLDDHDGDFAMEGFSIDDDRRALIPLLKEFAARIPPDVLKIWASPWCPPRWMKKTGCYASRPPWDGGEPNDCPEESRVYEGEDGFNCDEAHFRAYALYFRKYADAMRAEGLPIAWVMPQNEPNSAQPYPSCTWKSASLARFTLDYLCPAMEGSGTSVMLGTIERRSMELPDAVLSDPANRAKIAGAGFQWEGKEALVPVRKRYPDVFLVGTEQECGDGANDYAHARHCWELMCHYFEHGVSVYEYWNIALKTGSVSRWGWRQNSLVSVDPENASFSFNFEYYVLKHLSAFVKRGARRLAAGGDYGDALAFVNPDGSVVVALGNDSAGSVAVAVCGKRVDLPAKSIATVVLGECDLAAWK